MPGPDQRELTPWPARRPPTGPTTSSTSAGDDHRARCPRQPLRTTPRPGHRRGHVETRHRHPAVRLHPPQHTSWFAVPPPHIHPDRHRARTLTGTGATTATLMTASSRCPGHGPSQTARPGRPIRRGRPGQVFGAPFPAPEDGTYATPSLGSSGATRDTGRATRPDPARPIPSNRACSGKGPADRSLHEPEVLRRNRRHRDLSQPHRT